MPVQGYEYKVTERKVTCPFNPAHQVSDLQKHLTKCKSYDNTKGYKQCPFNATHYVLTPEFMHHVSTCEDKQLMERFMVGLTEEGQKPTVAGASSEGGDLSAPAPWRQPGDIVLSNIDSGAGPVDDDEDDWLSSANSGGTYNPLLATADRPIFRRPETHMGKSARNEFRRQSAQQLRQQMDDSGSSSSRSSCVGVSSLASSAFTTSVLRRPRVDPACSRNTAATGSAVASSLHVNPALQRGRGRGRGLAAAAPSVGHVGN